MTVPVNSAFVISCLNVAPTCGTNNASSSAKNAIPASSAETMCVRHRKIVNRVSRTAVNVAETVHVINSLVKTASPVLRIVEIAAATDYAICGCSKTVPTAHKIADNAAETESVTLALVKTVQIAHKIAAIVVMAAYRRSGLAVTAAIARNVFAVKHQSVAPRIGPTNV